MHRQQNKITRTWSNETCLRASRHQINWQSVHGNGGSFYSDLRNYAIGSRTRLDIAATTVTAAASAMAGKTIVDLGNGHEIVPNMYLMVVAPPGSGKTTPYKNLYLKAVTFIDEQLKPMNKSFSIQDATEPGLLTFVQDNPECTLSSDELVPALNALITNSDQMPSLRGFLNNVWSRSPYRRGFATQNRIEIDDATLSIYGLSQPTIYAPFVKRLIDNEDGLSHRFVTVFPPHEILYDEEPCAGSQEHPDPEKSMQFRNDINEMNKKIYAYHHPADGSGRTYTMSPEAAEYLDRVRLEHTATLQIQNDAMVAYIEEEHVMARPSIPDDHLAKDFDNGVKIACVLHLIDHFYQKTEVNCPAVLSLSVVQRAFEVITRCRLQMNVWMNALTELVEGPNVAAGGPGPIRVPARTSPAHIMKSILLFPGRIVSCRMFCRIHRPSVSAASVHAAMRGLARPPLDERYCGKVVELRGSVAFYKCPPDSVKLAGLDALDCSYPAYEIAFNNEIQTGQQFHDIKNRGFGGNFEEHYRKLVLATPGPLDGMSEASEDGSNVGSQSSSSTFNSRSQPLVSGFNAASSSNGASDSNAGSRLSTPGLNSRSQPSVSGFNAASVSNGASGSNSGSRSSTPGFNASTSQSSVPGLNSRSQPSVSGFNAASVSNGASGSNARSRSSTPGSNASSGSNDGSGGNTGSRSSHGFNSRAQLSASGFNQAARSSDASGCNTQSQPSTPSFNQVSDSNYAPDSNTGSRPPAIRTDPPSPQL